MPSFLGAEDLPDGHQCQCYYCRPLTFGQEKAPITITDAVRGRFKSSNFPTVDEVWIDDELSTRIYECQISDHPWAVRACEPTHLCNTCGGTTCMEMIYPKKIQVVLNDGSRFHYDRLARAQGIDASIYQRDLPDSDSALTK